MRLDRQISLKIAAPMLKLRKSRKPGIPILMYHSISQDDETGVHPYYRTTTSPDVFAQHMQFLRANNYQIISLTQAVQFLQHLKELDQSPNAVTTDPPSVLRLLSSGSMRQALSPMLSALCSMPYAFYR